MAAYLTGDRSNHKIGACCIAGWGVACKVGGEEMGGGELPVWPEDSARSWLSRPSSWAHFWSAERVVSVIRRQGFRMQRDLCDWTVFGGNWRGCDGQ
jgi:hypothetical protein